jgi:hypothetical protein
VSIKVLYILLLIGTGLVLWAAVAIYLRVRRHLRASSDHGLARDPAATEGQPRIPEKNS